MTPSVGAHAVGCTHRRADTVQRHTHESTDLAGLTRDRWPRTRPVDLVELAALVVQVWAGGSPSAARTLSCRADRRGATSGLLAGGLVSPDTTHVVTLLVAPDLTAAPDLLVWLPAVSCWSRWTPADRPLVGRSVVAAWRAVWQPSGASTGESHHPAPLPFWTMPSLVGCSLGGARVQGGAPGPRRAVERPCACWSASTTSPASWVVWWAPAAGPGSGHRATGGPGPGPAGRGPAGALAPALSRHGGAW